MKVTATQCFPQKFNSSKAEKYNGWSAMIGIIFDIGAYRITGQIILGAF